MKIKASKARRIVLVPPRTPRIPPQLVASALGVEEVTKCFKHGCHRSAITWERRGDEPPAALCAKHAMRPDRSATIDLPTLVPRS